MVEIDKKIIIKIKTTNIRMNVINPDLEKSSILNIKSQKITAARNGISNRNKTNGKPSLKIPKIKLNKNLI